MASKLVSAAAFNCPGLECPEEPRPIQISQREGTAHPVVVQHLLDNTTNVLCGYFRDGVCNAVFKEGKKGGLELSGKTAPCPFKVSAGVEEGN